ncbi:MAG: zinc ribbon-containing protein [Acidiferrobacter sp.]
MKKSSRTDEFGPKEKAYEQMLTRVVRDMHNKEKVTVAQLQEAIHDAGQQVVELGALTAEEVTLVGGYLKRDLIDAINYVARTGNQLKDWLGFESDVIESELMYLFLEAADKTQWEQMKIKEMSHVPVYRTGEITGPGTLVCANCGKKLHSRNPIIIPSCPVCHSKGFHRRH